MESRCTIRSRHSGELEAVELRGWPAGDGAATDPRNLNWVMPAEGDVSTTTPPAAVVVAGGDLVPPGATETVPPGAFIIAADSGLHSAQALGLGVDLVVGDFDSVDAAAVDRAVAAGAAMERHPADKDATDLELGLEAALARGLSPVLVIGGAGGDRIDHFLANALLLARPRYAPLRLRWRAGASTITPVHHHLDISGRPGDLVTLLAVGGPAEGVTTTGLRWPLGDGVLEPGSTRGVSNRMTGSAASVSLRGGTLVAVHTGGTP